MLLFLLFFSTGIKTWITVVSHCDNYFMTLIPSAKLVLLAWQVVDDKIMNILFHKNEKNSYHKHKKTWQQLKKWKLLSSQNFCRKNSSQDYKKKVLNETFLFHFPWNNNWCFEDILSCYIIHCLYYYYVTRIEFR